MFVNNDIDYEYVLDFLFGQCSHHRVDPRFYCQDCKMFIKDEELKNIDDLKNSLSYSTGIDGGFYISRLIRFICHYTEKLEIVEVKKNNWYELCMISKNEKAYEYYHTDGKHSFAYQVA